MNSLEIAEWKLRMLKRYFQIGNKEGFSNFLYEQSLRYFIRNLEERIVFYKKLLEDRIEDVWLKDTVRNSKNSEEAYLKELREELTYYRQGLNPPYCYLKLKQ